MDSLSEFFAMGGYAKWVWPAYGAAALALIGLLLFSLRTLRSREQEFAVIRKQRRGDHDA